jgi:hypothetical protein
MPLLVLGIACNICTLYTQSIYYNVPVKTHLQIVCSWKKNKDILLYSILINNAEDAQLQQYLVKVQFGQFCPLKSVTR